MSNRAPVTGTAEFREAFSKADSDLKFGFLNIGIDFKTNKFYSKQYQQNTDDDIEKVFGEMRKLCVEKEHTYFLVRDPTLTKSSSNLKQNDNDSNNNKSLNLYIVIHYAPDLSPVKQRMMYASSRASLKLYLGQANFTEDYHCNELNELGYKNMMDARSLHHNIDFRSDAEIEKEQANMETYATSAKSKVLASLPIDIKDSAKTAIESYKSSSVQCVTLTLNNKDQSVIGEEHKIDQLSDMTKLLKDTEPKYLLFWASYSKEVTDELQKGNKRVFGYYCPVKANRKLRFTYSTCKTNIMEYCHQNDIKFFGKVEFTEIDDFTPDFIDYHVFPQKEVKDNFAMPKAPKTRRKSKTKKRKKINVDDL